jgi:hypothetical protein
VAVVVKAIMVTLGVLVVEHQVGQIINQVVQELQVKVIVEVIELTAIILLVLAVEAQVNLGLIKQVMVALMVLLEVMVLSG